MNDTDPILYSVRMRAAANLGAQDRSLRLSATEPAEKDRHRVGGEPGDKSRHLSGAERLVPEADLAATTQELLARALTRGIPPDSIRLSIDRVPVNQVIRIPCLPVTTINAADPGQARDIAAGLLADAGVGPEAIALAFEGLLSGLGPHGAGLRGAALMDRRTGERLEHDQARGIRASHLDYAPDHREPVGDALARAGLPHHRTLEALAVASKVVWAGLRAELCWSDDPEYAAGYVATPAMGYVRFPQFKPSGARGGRVWFVASGGTDFKALAEKLERQCVMVEGPVTVMARQY